MKGLSYKVPFNSIKKFLKINFENYIGLLSLHFPKVRDHLLDNDNIVRGSSVKKKAGLDGADDRIKVGLDSVSNNFGNNFILVLQIPIGLKFLR